MKLNFQRYYIKEEVIYEREQCVKEKIRIRPWNNMEKSKIQ